MATYNAFFVPGDPSIEDPIQFGQDLADKLERKCNDLVRIGYQLVGIEQVVRPDPARSVVGTSGLIVVARFA